MFERAPDGPPFPTVRPLSHTQSATLHTDCRKMLRSLRAGSPPTKLFAAFLVLEDSPAGNTGTAAQLSEPSASVRPAPLREAAFRGHRRELSPRLHASTASPGSRPVLCELDSHQISALRFQRAPNVRTACRIHYEHHESPAPSTRNFPGVSAGRHRR